MKWLFILLTIVAPGGPASGCDFGGEEMVRAELLFGRTAVPAAEWDYFLSRTVTPLFPDGMTVLDGNGQWRSPKSGSISREASTVLLILVKPASDLRARLDAVRETYKSRFHQQSVGLVTSVSCVAF